jgi:hypothetical protein
MTLTPDNQSTWRKICPTTTLYTINFTRTDMGTNPGLRGKTSPTNRLSHGTALNHDNLNYFSVYTVNFHNIIVINQPMHHLDKFY